MKNIHFPKSELYDLKARLLLGRCIYTTRIYVEKDAYQTGDIVANHFLGNMRVIDILPLEDAYLNHPFKDELNETQKEILLGQKGNLLTLVGFNKGI